MEDRNGAFPSSLEHGYPRRLLNLLFILNTSVEPPTTDEIIGDSDLGYGSGSRDSDLKKYTRDRDKLAQQGFHIVEITGAGGRQNEQSTWTVDRLRTHAELGLISASDAEILAHAVDAATEGGTSPLMPALSSIRARLRGRIDVPPQQDTARSIDPRLSTIWNAWCLRRALPFDYTDSKGESRSHSVEIYGLFSQAGHGYFVGRDVEDNAIKTFRCDRVRATRKPAGAYDIPQGFSIRDYRFLPFDFSGSGLVDVSFSFPRTLGAAEIEDITHGRGAIVSGPHDVVTWNISVRSIDAAARFALAHASAGMRPASPNALVDAWNDILKGAVETYG